MGRTSRRPHRRRARGREVGVPLVPLDFSNAQEVCAASRTVSGTCGEHLTRVPIAPPSGCGRCSGYGAHGGYGGHAGAAGTRVRRARRARFVPRIFRNAREMCAAPRRVHGGLTDLGVALTVPPAEHDGRAVRHRSRAPLLPVTCSAGVSTSSEPTRSFDRGRPGRFTVRSVRAASFASLTESTFRAESGTSSTRSSATSCASTSWANDGPMRFSRTPLQPHCGVFRDSVPGRSGPRCLRTRQPEAGRALP
ncbi:hypothetical protein CLV46_0734 [Diaminobutyricimonas aerilata]|uniref:Uncharacterized protein n=1 Tax=Diaminobutyricimonas aerilata TaxID=1162967 RepID=A0A2M9CH47_9MICO|nr:hypothetical protein CLV46_0734 [Diaminobutyricimonas aerilata]